MLCVKECEDLIKSVQQEGDSRLTCEWRLAKMKRMCEACKKMKSQASWITTGKKVQSDLVW